jgi:rubrerythrin
MSFRNALARIVLADARRFEVETAAMLRDILPHCADPAARRVVEEILAEEEAHAVRLSEVSAGVKAAKAEPSAAERAALPAVPSVAPVACAGPACSKDVCDRLRDVLAKEEASVRFYSLLADRALIPSVRNLFREIAEQERGHARKLAAVVGPMCGGK